MYCQKCGKELDEVSSQCNYCGIHNSEYKQQTNQTVYAIRDKNEGIAVILSIFLIGFGQIYAGKIVRGVVFFIGAIIISSIGFLFFIPLLVLVALWIYNIFDAYNLAKEYNEYVSINGQKPW